MSEQTLIKYLKEQILQQQTIIEDLLMGVDDNELEKEAERLDRLELAREMAKRCFAAGYDLRAGGEVKEDDFIRERYFAITRAEQAITASMEARKR